MDSGPMHAFTIFWAGQVVSLLGTRMSRFARLIWAWERTGEATAMVLVSVFAAVPALAVGLVAGALVDRWNRKHILMVSDLLAGLSTAALLLLYVAGQLEVWHLYAAAALVSGANTFQGLAYSAAVTTMLPKQQYARASGMMSLGEYASVIGAPLLAGLLVSRIGIAGVLIMDILTFLVGVGALALVEVPQPTPTESDDYAPTGLLRDSLFGFRYLFGRPPLVALLLISSVLTLVEPMILARTGSDAATLGLVQALRGAGASSAGWR